MQTVADNLTSPFSSCAQFSLVTGNMSWQKLGPTGAAPPGCAAHAAVAVGKHVYVFGGMTPTGALNTMYKYDTGEQKSFPVFSL